MLVIPSWRRWKHVNELRSRCPYVRPLGAGSQSTQVFRIIVSNLSEGLTRVRTERQHQLRHLAGGVDSSQDIQSLEAHRPH
jgi:hypothetical protein